MVKENFLACYEVNMTFAMSGILGLGYGTLAKNAYD